jgi:hypothetical protein
LFGKYFRPAAKRAPRHIVLIEQRDRQDNLSAFYREMVLEMNRQDLEADNCFSTPPRRSAGKTAGACIPVCPSNACSATTPVPASLLLAGTAEHLLARPLLLPSHLAVRMLPWWPRRALREIALVSVWEMAAGCHAPCFRSFLQQQRGSPARSRSGKPDITVSFVY